MSRRSKCGMARLLVGGCVLEWGRDRTAELTLKGAATFALREDLMVEGEGGRQRYNQVMVPTNSIWRRL